MYGSSRTNYELAEFAEEAICAFIMSLSVLDSIYLSSVNSENSSIKVIIYSVLGANVAWGLIDGVVQYVGIRVRRARFRRLSKSLKSSMSLDQFISHLQHNIDEDIIHSWGADAVSLLFEKKEAIAEPKRKSSIRMDLFAFVGVFFVYVLTALLIVAPLMISKDLYSGVIIANMISTVGLFVIGYTWGRSTETNPLLLGTITALMGLALLGLCILFGG